MHVTWNRPLRLSGSSFAVLNQELWKKGSDAPSSKGMHVLTEVEEKTESEKSEKESDIAGNSHDYEEETMTKDEEF